MLADKTFTLGAQGDVLTVDDGAVQGLTVRNLPGALTVEYSDKAYLEVGGVRQDLSTDVDWAAASLSYLCF